MKTPEGIHFGRIAARTAEEKLGERIVLLDVRRQTAFTDGFLIVGATSHLHVRALEDAIRERLKSTGARLLRTDGQRGGVWRALDYGGLVVHIMDNNIREFYSLERLWDEGKRITWRGPLRKKKSPKKRKKRK